MSESHTNLLKLACAAVARVAGIYCRMFPNEIGTALQGRPQFVSRPGMVKVDKGDVIIRRFQRVPYGLLPGSGDRIGWSTITITPEMVGRRVAVFTSAEGKVGSDRMSAEQRHWHDTVREAGGVSVEVREPGDLAAAVRAFVDGLKSQRPD